MKMRGLFLTLQNPTKIYVTGELEFRGQDVCDKR